MINTLFAGCPGPLPVPDAAQPSDVSAEIIPQVCAEKKFQANELESAYDRHPGRNTQ